MTKIQSLARRVGALALVCAGLFGAAPVLAAGTGNVLPAGTNLGDRASLHAIAAVAADAGRPG